MSKYHDDSTFASNPGALEVSDSKLRQLEPALFEERTFKCGPMCPVDHPASEMRERFAEHMKLGDTQPAIVVSTDPLIVSVAAIDLDAAILLRFPNSLVEQYGLSVGSRLMSVNTYLDLQNQEGEIYYAVDIIPGAQRTNWSNACPYIADFLCLDEELIEQKKEAIPNAEWNRLERNTNARIDKWGLDTARDGNPLHAATPIPIDATAPTILYRTLSGEAFDPVAEGLSRIKRYAFIGLLVIVAIVLLYLYLRG
jgi:hypothetical protein